MKISISLDEEEIKILSKRAKKNLLTIREMVEDIIRRSCISSKDSVYKTTKVDDSFVEIFSRERKGRKARRK